MERVAHNSSYLNAISTTGTATRVKDVSPTSGMCPICIRDCTAICEIGLSAFRGREALYPRLDKFGQSTAASLKDYFLDWSHITILSDLLGVYGIEENPDLALFPRVDISSNIGGINLKLPIITGAYGSTAVAKNNWRGLAIGAALSGVILTIGENVCGMDPESKFVDGKVVSTKDLEWRIKTYRDFWDGKNGDIVVQTNVEDQRMGVDVYAISKLEVNVIERKWGQGAKAIGGEVRLNSLEEAIELKRRGYLLLPDPEDEHVQEAFKSGIFRTFERHSRVGIPHQKDFLEDIEWLRHQGAKHIFLKTGAYRPTAVAFTMKVASEAKVDAVTFDGAGGGTGMSPVPMMNEMSTPVIYLESQVLRCAEILKKNGKYVPDISMAGGFMNETQILKSIAMSNLGDGPKVKAITMGRAPLTAVMKSSYFVELSDQGKLPKSFADQYGSDPSKFFVGSMLLKEWKEKEIPWEAIGLYTYLHDRIGVGLKQLMAGVRKWKLNLLGRDDIASLTERAAKVTGIPLLEDIESEQFEIILGL
ncbi:MAG: glutamate synthase-related protein [Thermoproteota archaeon]